MKFRLNRNVFVRHMGDESIVCCPRTEGYIVLRNAQAIIEEVTREWRSVDENAFAVAAKIGCGTDEVREGVEAVVGELVGQRFVEIEGGEDVPSIVSDGENAVATSSNEQKRVPPDKDEDWTPLGDFYVRHGLPSELHIDLTDGCNEKCVHCYLPHGGAHYIDKDVALKVLKEFREAQGLTVYVSGGECMLHRDFADILRYAKSIDLNIIVMSNLTLCDEKMVALLKDIDPQFINVSLYAVTEAIHDSITQVPGSCRKTKAAIDELQSAGVHIRIATPFMRENKGCVAELKEYAEKRHVHLIASSEIFGRIDHLCSNQEHSLSLKEVNDILTRNKDVFYKGLFGIGRCEENSKVCEIGDAKLNVDADGGFYPCDGFHGVIIGDARKDTLWEVWTGEPLNKLRALKNKDFGACASCADRAWCKVCPMRNFNETGNMFTHAPWRCEATRIYKRVFEEKQLC